MLAAVAKTAIAVTLAEPEPALVPFRHQERLWCHAEDSSCSRRMNTSTPTEPLLALDFVQGTGRRIGVEQREMRLAVLAQPVGQGLYAPLLRLYDLTARLLDDAFELQRKLLDLLRARVLARQEYVLVVRHADAFPSMTMPFRRKALRA
jgi:hypothetical protein